MKSLIVKTFRRDLRGISLIVSDSNITSALAANSLDVRADPNIWDNDVRQMDTIMSALDDVVDRYDCK